MKLTLARGLGLSLFFVLVVAAFADGPKLPPPPQLPSSTLFPANQPTPDLAELVRGVIIASTSEGFSDDRHWNKTATRFDGLKVRGLNISKRKKTVQHGFCHKYEAKLRNPEKNFKLTIEETELPNDEQATGFVITAALRARCEATFAHFVYGVKGINGTTVADADIRVRILISIDPTTEFSLSSPIPKLYLNMKVRDVDLWVKDIDAHKIGILDGKLAELVGDTSQEAVEQLVQTQESKIKRQLQKEIDNIQGQPHSGNK